METDKMSTASSVGAAERRPLLQALVLERRILFGGTVFVGLSTFIWIAAMCTENWVTISGGDYGIYLETNRYLMWSNSGVWEICRNVFQPEGNITKENAPPNMKDLKGRITLPDNFEGYIVLPDALNVYNSCEWEEHMQQRVRVK